MLTIDQVEKALPASLKSAVDQPFVDKVNNLITDPEVAETFRENFISYTVVMREGKFKTEDYMHAVAYVSFKHMGYSNGEAYARAHPQRYARLVANNTSSKDLAAYVSAYHKGKLVNLIMEQSLVPMWIVNQDMYQKAINVQADLMINAASEKVRSDAANSILTHLAKPKEAATNINVNMPDNSGMRELKGMLDLLAQKQIDLIGSGVTAEQIAGQKLIPQADYVEVPDGAN